MDGNKIIDSNTGFIGKATNNEAEYTAIINALEAAEKYKRHVEVYSDSELVIKQINGQYQVKQSNMQTLWDKVKPLSSKFGQITFMNASREDTFIKKADNLCNKCLDEYQSQNKAKS